MLQINVVIGDVKKKILKKNYGIKEIRRKVFF